MEMRFLLVTSAACIACLLLWRVFPWERTRFQGIPGYVFLVDVLLWPLMKLGATGKITHWWDWKPVLRSHVDPNVRPLIVASQMPQQRVYKTSILFGRYNLEGLKDLYKTLFVLQVVVVLEPESYDGFWRLLVAGNRYQGKNQYALYDQVDLLVRGRLKTLLDGRKYFVGQAEDGTYIPLKLVEITTRDQYPDIPFV
jgi:hypothetical protein